MLFAPQQLGHHNGVWLIYVIHSKYVYYKIMVLAAVYSFLLTVHVLVCVVKTRFYVLFTRLPSVPKEMGIGHHDLLTLLQLGCCCQDVLGEEAQSRSSVHLVHQHTSTHTHTHTHTHRSRERKRMFLLFINIPVTQC